MLPCLVGGDSATVKRFHREGKRIQLLPENEAYSPIELTTVDFETGEARILGVAKEVKNLPVMRRPTGSILQRKVSQT